MKIYCPSTKETSMYILGNKTDPPCNQRSNRAAAASQKNLSFKHIHRFHCKKHHQRTYDGDIVPMHVGIKRWNVLLDTNVRHFFKAVPTVVYIGSLIFLIQYIYFLQDCMDSSTSLSVRILRNFAC